MTYDRSIPLRTPAPPLSEGGQIITAPITAEPPHLDTARSLTNLALLLQAQGDYAAARPLFERALVITERTLGPDHSDTARSLANLASLDAHRGDFATAVALAERAWLIQARVLGREHPDTQRIRQNLENIRAAAQRAGSAPQSRQT